MVKVTENYITNIEPQNDFEKSYNVTIYENVKKLDNGTYSSTKLVMNQIEFKEYQNAKIYQLEQSGKEKDSLIDELSYMILDLTLNMNNTL